MRVGAYQENTKSCVTALYCLINERMKNLPVYAHTNQCHWTELRGKKNIVRFAILPYIKLLSDLSAQRSTVCVVWMCASFFDDALFCSSGKTGRER